MSFKLGVKILEICVCTTCAQRHFPAQADDLFIFNSGVGVRGAAQRFKSTMWNQVYRSSMLISVNKEKEKKKKKKKKKERKKEKKSPNQCEQLYAAARQFSRDRVQIVDSGLCDLILGIN